LSLVSAGLIALFVFILRWGKALNVQVEKRTAELRETNEQLERANSVLSEYNVQLGNAFEMVVNANERLEAHDKMQREFINIAAHELRTPIQPLLGAAETIEAGAKGADKIEITRAELQMIVRNARRLEKLSSEIIEASRIESKSLVLHKEAIDLNEKVDNVVASAKSLATDKQLQIIIEHPQDPVIVEGDRPRLFEVIWNLVYNAIKFTESGTIAVKIEKLDNYATVTVKDSGIGIDSDILPRLFTRFSGRSEGADTGAGLGLYLAKSIIEAHGGKIWGQNNPDGRGATFGFSLPLRQSREISHV
jgi:signal transduction histidine kinase